MIICAALLVQVEGLDHLTVIPCRRHGDGYLILKDLGYAPKKGYKVIEDGFITHTGEFLNRLDAYKHADECGQLSESVRMVSNNKALISEDLY